MEAGYGVVAKWVEYGADVVWSGMAEARFAAVCRGNDGCGGCGRGIGTALFSPASCQDGGGAIRPYSLARAYGLKQKNPRLGWFS